MREDLAGFESTGEVDAAALDLAYDFMYLAEGSDWFWWYGDDQDSGQDSYFDEGYRALLAGVYESLGEEVPRFVQVPIIQAAPVSPDRPFSGASTPEIDGQEDLAWEASAYYPISSDAPINGLYATLDKENLYLRLDLEGSLRDTSLGFYINSPGFEGASTAFAYESEVLLGFNANKLLYWEGGVSVGVYDGDQDGWSLFDLGAGRAMMGEEIMEISVPFRLLGDLTAGDALTMTLIVEPTGESYPLDGPAQIVLPDLGETVTVLQVKDPIGDDYGPGTYIYPEDAVFKESVFDANSFYVGYDAEKLVLKFGFVGAVENPWG